VTDETDAASEWNQAGPAFEALSSRMQQRWPSWYVRRMPGGVRDALWIQTDVEMLPKRAYEMIWNVGLGVTKFTENGRIIVQNPDEDDND